MIQVTNNVALTTLNITIVLIHVEFGTIDAQLYWTIKKNIELTIDNTLVSRIMTIRSFTYYTSLLILLAPYYSITVKFDVNTDLCKTRLER